MTTEPTTPTGQPEHAGGFANWWHRRHAAACACAGNDQRVAALDTVGTWLVAAGASIAGIGALKAVVAGGHIISRDVSDMMSAVLIPATAGAAGLALIVMLAIVLLVGMAGERGAGS